MKKAILLTFVLLTAGLYSASAQTKTTPEKSTVTKGSTVMSKFQGKKMKVQSHTKDGSAVTHTAADYVLFNADGTYEQSFNGVTRHGTWTINTTTNVLTVICGNTFNYTINAPSDTKLGLTSATEELILIL